MLTLLWILCYVNSFEGKSYTPEITAPRDETHLPTILSRYRLEDIFNAGEFGLFFQALPSRTLKLKGEKWSGGKHSKVRLTGMCAATATGEKLPVACHWKEQKSEGLQERQVLAMSV